MLASDHLACRTNKVIQCSSHILLHLLVVFWHAYEGLKGTSVVNQCKSQSDNSNVVVRAFIFCAVSSADWHTACRKSLPPHLSQCLPPQSGQHRFPPCFLTWRPWQQVRNVIIPAMTPMQ